MRPYVCAKCIAPVPCFQRRRKREQGVSLIVTMLMLVAMTMITLSAAHLAVQEEKAARAERDRQIAMQAAEAALLDAELDIDTSSRSALFSPGTSEGFAFDCGNGQPGLYLGLYRQPGQESRPVWQVVDFTGRKADICSVPYGRFTGKLLPTGAGTLPAASPRYIIELMIYAGASGTASYYRITAIGFGTRPTTQVALQTLYRKAGNGTVMPTGRISWREIPNWKELRDAFAKN